MNSGLTDRAWHYAIALSATRIYDSRHIRPSTVDVPRTERPVVWFSTAVFEPTIAEPAYRLPDGGILRPKGAAEFRVFGGGLYRFGLPLARLLPYAQGIKECGMSFTRRRKLERIAQQFGGRPHEWHVYDGVVSLLDPDLDFSWFDGKAWVRASVGDAPAVFKAQAAEIRPELEALLAAPAGRARDLARGG